MTTAIDTAWLPVRKPRLYRFAGTWFCREGEQLGYGQTPSEAFRHWLLESLQRYDFA